MAGMIPPTPQINAPTDIWGMKYWIDRAQKWIRGTSEVKPLTITANYAIQNDESFYGYVIDTTGGSVVLTLPPANGSVGKKFFVKMKVTNAIAVVNPYSGDTIDGSASVILTTANDWVEIVSDGVNKWWIVSKTSSGSSASIPFYRTTGMTIPTTSTFAGGMGTIASQTNKTDRFQITKLSAPGAMAMLYVTPPVTPYTVDVCGTMHGMPPTNDDVLIGAARSDGTKLQVIWGGAAATNIANFPVIVQKWNTTASVSTTVATGLASLGVGVTYLRFTDDGTTASYYYSNNGKDYFLVFSEPHNTWLTASRVGIAVYFSGTVPAGALAKFAFYDFTVTNSILGDAP